MDLLRRFAVARCRDEALTDEVPGGEVELGLSLGGCFGAEPEKNRLARAASISRLSMHDDEGIDQQAMTCSLPMESKEEHRKRDRLQSSKRMEVKRRRLGTRESKTIANHDSDGRAVDGLSRLRSISQRSVGSQGSSGLSDFDCHGSSSCEEVELKIPPLSTPLSLSIEEDKQSKMKLEIADKAKEIEKSMMEEVTCKQSKEKLGMEDKEKELERSKMENMPCVSTRGNGPNGRMIQGLLYKYGHGEDVRIVCVCHGSFLTPAEFVRHAGGGDVAHPLRHIVVHRPPLAF